MAGLYLHIPFCSQRCVYCDFYFVTTRASHTTFVEAMRAELEQYAQGPNAPDALETIYLGGGTPSLLHEDEVVRLLDAVHTHFDTSALEEVTFELNPEDADLEYLRTLRHLGVDRLSIGVQSFYGDDLTWMNRSHTADEAAAVIDTARKAGFDNFSVDLIFGLPEQPFEYWAANLQKVADREVPHLSTYSLTIEERTPLHKQVQLGHVVPAGDEALADRYRFTMDYLRERGYEHYEISSFARPGARAVHNSRYWSHHDYLGLGPSAHGFRWKSGSTAERWANVRNLKRYEALLAGRNLPIDVREDLRLDELANEYLMLRLRTAEGVDLAHLDRRYGADLVYERGDVLEAFVADGLVEPITTHVRLTDAGKLVCDAVTGQLLLDDLVG